MKNYEHLKNDYYQVCVDTMNDEQNMGGMYSFAQLQILFNMAQHNVLPDDNFSVEEHVIWGMLR